MSDSTVAQNIARIIAEAGGHFSVAARSFSGSAEFMLDTDELHPAASVIKVPIMAAALAARDQGVVSFDQEIMVRKDDLVGGSGVLLEMHNGIVITLRDAIQLMIVVSDNTATNLVIDAVGLDYIRGFISQHNFNNIRLERRLFDMEARARGLDNWINAREMLDLLEALYRGELPPLSAESCKEAISIMERQQFHEKIHALLPKGTKVADKTGGLSDVTHDAGIVWPEQGPPFGIVLLSKELTDDRPAKRAQAQIARELYDYFTTSTA